MLPEATCRCGHPLGSPESSEGKACPVCGRARFEEEAGSTDPANTLPLSEVENGGRPSDLPEIPGYQVLEVLGEGGMGRVFRARDTRLGREVALKMILAGGRIDSLQRARFQIEAEALASLQHPNIVQIHEVGEHQGNPFLTLEIVDGGHLGERVNKQPLGPREAAGLVASLARAIQAAHHHGIIHRDLKPSNILLSKGTAPSGIGIPKIADFGLAKRLEGDGGHTLPGAILGTPAYMAPEQTRGDQSQVGPAADIYSLGVLLYACLVGRAPFQGGTMELFHQVQHVEPIPPTRYIRSIPKDLETICLKAMQKEPQRRYDSAAALAEDLERYLRHEPIRARPSTLPERAVKWVRRRPTAAALVLVSLGALAALAALGWWSHTRLRDAAERAENRLRLARRLVDEYVEVAREGLADTPGQDSLQRHMLEKALGLYTELAAEAGSDRHLVHDSARARIHLGAILRALGRFDEAKTAYDEAIALLEPLAEEGDKAYRRTLADAHHGTGEWYRESAGDLEGAAGSYRRARAILEDLVVDDPKAADSLRDLARSRYHLGLAALDGGQAEEALPHFDAADRILTGLIGPGRGEGKVVHELARTCINRGILHRQGERWAQAEADYRRAKALLILPEVGSVLAGVSWRVDTGVVHQNLGNLLQGRGRVSEAEMELRAAEAVFERLVEEFPHRNLLRYKLASTRNSLGSTLAFQKKWPAAETSWNQARRDLAGPLKSTGVTLEMKYLRGLIMGNLGWLQTSRGDWPQAVPLLEGACDQLSDLHEKHPARAEFAIALRNQRRTQAETYLQVGNHAGAARAARSMAAIEPADAQHRYWGACFLARAARLADKGKEAKAFEEYENAALRLLAVAADSAGVVERIPQEEEVFAVFHGNPKVRQALRGLSGKTPSARMP